MEDQGRMMDDGGRERIRNSAADLTLASTMHIQGHAYLAYRIATDVLWQRARPVFRQLQEYSPHTPCISSFLDHIE